MSGQTITVDPAGEYFHVVGGRAGHQAVTEDLYLAASSIDKAATLLHDATTQVRRQQQEIASLPPGWAVDEIHPVAVLAEAAVERVIAGRMGTVAVADSLRDLAHRLLVTTEALVEAEERAFRYVSMTTRQVEAGKDVAGLMVWFGRAALAYSLGQIPGLMMNKMSRDSIVAVMPKEAPETTGILNGYFSDMVPMHETFYRVMASLLAARLGVEELNLLERPTVAVVAEATAMSSEAPSSGVDLLDTVYRTEQRGDGAVTVQQVSGPEGDAWIVSIPGTQDWLFDGNPFDGQGAVAAAGRIVSNAMSVVIAAMNQAGIQPGDAVMLAGHSQGGYLSMALASSPAFVERYGVTHVVTTGSGHAQMNIPPTVQSLHLEHPEDLVTGVDFGAPEDRPHQTTFVHDISHSSNDGLKKAGQTLLGAHHLDGYKTTMALAESGVSSSVDHFMDSASMFLTGDSVQTTAYVPSTEYPKAMGAPGSAHVAKPAS